MTAEEQFADEQMGFRKKVGPRDQIFNLRILMEKAHEYNVPLYISFIDFKKAFGSVCHTTVECADENGSYLNCHQPTAKTVPRTASSNQNRK